jgi:hypothetical protein
MEFREALEQMTKILEEERARINLRLGLLDEIETLYTESVAESPNLPLDSMVPPSKEPDNDDRPSMSPVQKRLWKHIVHRFGDGTGFFVRDLKPLPKSLDSKGLHNHVVALAKKGWLVRRATGGYVIWTAV